MMHGNALTRFALTVRCSAWCSVLEECAERALFCSTVVPIGELKQLLQQAIAILQTEATVVDLPAPCKVFGDIHGQFTDLKKFFKTYGVLLCAWLNRCLGQQHTGISPCSVLISLSMLCRPLFRVTQPSYWRCNFVPVCVHRRFR